GQRACAVVNYTLVSPKGDILSLDAEEIWEMQGGKLVSMEMHFDTAAYQKFMMPALFPISRLKKKRNDSG
ncbi:MAG TPA: hypothetical protein PLO51_05205, partial [Candidatus Micrarchaeota archaeon]|nr:hypothetical protein [Candidatus Micrarchaeota archaeon]